MRMLEYSLASLPSLLNSPTRELFRSADTAYQLQLNDFCPQDFLNELLLTGARRRSESCINDKSGRR
jgi:hypothetical protein